MPLTTKNPEVQTRTPGRLLFQRTTQNNGKSELITFSHPDYTVGLRITLSRRPPPAPVLIDGQIKLGVLIWEPVDVRGLGCPRSLTAGRELRPTLTVWPLTLPRR